MNCLVSFAATDRTSRELQLHLESACPRVLTRGNFSDDYSLDFLEIKANDKFTLTRIYGAARNLLIFYFDEPVASPMANRCQSCLKDFRARSPRIDNLYTLLNRFEATLPAAIAFVNSLTVAHFIGSSVPALVRRGFVMLFRWKVTQKKGLPCLGIVFISDVLIFK